LLQHAKVAGDSGAADRERAGQLLHRALVRAEQGEDRATGGMTEGVEGVVRRGAR
jgi:hypothetical protein